MMTTGAMRVNHTSSTTILASRGITHRVGPGHGSRPLLGGPCGRRPLHPGDPRAPPRHPRRVARALRVRSMNIPDSVARHVRSRTVIADVSANAETARRRMSAADGQLTKARNYIAKEDWEASAVFAESALGSRRPARARRERGRRGRQGRGRAQALPAPRRASRAMSGPRSTISAAPA